jgi:hypothetical protein
VFWAIFVNGLVAGATYSRGGVFGPLGCQVIAPLCSAVAYIFF